MDSSSLFFRNEILICQQCCKIFGEAAQYQHHECKPNRERFLTVIAKTTEIQLARGIWKSWKTQNPVYQCLEYDEAWYFLPEVTKQNWLRVSRMLKNGNYMMSKGATNQPKPTAGQKIKKFQAKKLVKSNKSNFFFREIAFLAVLTLFPVQKLIFGRL